MRLANPAHGHLTYCTNIHAAEHWPDVREGLEKRLPEIKSRLVPDQPMGVGLRLAASAANALEQPEALAELKLLLGEDYYIFTINGFPYGTFHGKTVKENAYTPDWSDAARLEYTNTLANILAEILPEGMEGSISTVPGTFKPWARAEPLRIDLIVENLIAHVAVLVDLRRRTGKTISLALEPEPCCLLETIEETVVFFEQHLLSNQSISQLAVLTGLSSTEAENTIRNHLGVCYDVCHAAVEFEQPRASIERLQQAGIKISKMQLSSALKIACVDRQTEAQLRPFVEPVYLHQVVQKKDAQLKRFVDLDVALKELASAQDSEWRIHFHVPIFLPEMQHFATTQSFLCDILDLHKQQPVCDHLEVETYTWDVLPESYRNVGVSDAIARELNWVKSRLAS